MSDPLSLGEVLRRCHRAELEALAHAVAIKPVLSMGRDQLAAAIETALRRAGSNDIASLLLRRGSPPPYEAVLDELARRQGLRPPGAAPPARRRIPLRRHPSRPRRGAPAEQGGALVSDVEALERALVERHREARGQAALASPRPLLARAGLGASLLGLRLLMPLLGPAAGIAFLLWLGRRRDDVLLPAVAEVARLRALVARRVTVGVVGPPSSGKDAAIQAIFGVDTGNISPVAGSTSAVAVYPVAGGEGLEVVNTPGLGDVQQRLTDETRSVLDQVDLFLFLVNAQGGVRARERGEWERVRARGRPALVVVNKLDTLREADRERLVADTAAKLEVPPEGIVGAAVDPLPQLLATPMGVHAIREWLHARLAELGRGRLPG